jgi:hypothetical protein
MSGEILCSKLASSRFSCVIIASNVTVLRSQCAARKILTDLQTATTFQLILNQLSRDTSEFPTVDIEAIPH